jgi:NTE family protein
MNPRRAETEATAPPPPALPHPVAFVLGGGGSFGAVQVGMLQALTEVELGPDLVVGTSVGAINGAALAADPHGAANRLGHTWPEIARETVFPGGPVDRVRTWYLHRTYLVHHEALRRQLERNLDAERIDDLPLPFAAIATDLTTGEDVRIESGPLVPALLASAAIPGFYPHVRVDGRDLVDGGVVSNVPIGHALEMGARSVVVLDCGLVAMRPQGPPSLGDLIVHVIAITIHRQLVAELPQITAQVPVLYMPAPEQLFGSPLEFDHTLVHIRDAYEASRAFLREVEVAGPGLYGRPPLVKAQDLPRAPEAGSFG